MTAIIEIWQGFSLSKHAGLIVKSYRAEKIQRKKKLSSGGFELGLLEKKTCWLDNFLQ